MPFNALFASILQVASQVSLHSFVGVAFNQIGTASGDFN